MRKNVGRDPVVVRGLTRNYGKTAALRGVDLEVRRGEVFALLGPNGAGKTTTVEILCGARGRTAGDVRVLGCDPAEDRRAWRARIGVVPQTTGAFPDLTVREVVRSFAAMYPAPLPVDRVLDMVGLAARRDTLTSTLSGGQQRRLDVAVGVVGDPELLFLDEPTTGLDPAARREAWELVRFFAARGTTTLLTTHYLDEAEELAERAAVIVAGQVVACGGLADLGGRGHRPATVAFRASGALAGRAMPAGLPGDARVDRDGDSVVVHTDTPTAALAALLPWAAAAGALELPELRVHRATLEEAYLDLIGVRNAAHPGDGTDTDGKERAA
ncbi:ABC transporter ATP-binding protein [Yinghuangia seranimata]|uniref:ABC transporter ATP-binding protein n=1 Tax=Yinghuangia seranimata TaxID=408067 RepID=UPI00248AA3E9|nr:ABC transporter ATP-binding protein [Yinghuangia seranimata]MDI2130070.1 ABC transporter ATP-binding protein [Yinghuangia seranimata]